MRVTLRSQTTYRTRKNRFRTSRSPGGCLKAIKIDKNYSRPKSKDNRSNLGGLKKEKPSIFMNSCRRKKTVSRPFGGTLSHNSVLNKIKKAFLLEEQKIVKEIMKNSSKQS